MGGDPVASICLNRLPHHSIARGAWSGGTLQAKIVKAYQVGMPGGRQSPDGSVFLFLVGRNESFEALQQFLFRHAVELQFAVVLAR